MKKLSFLLLALLFPTTLLAGSGYIFNQGVTSINGDSNTAQLMSVGVAGVDFAITNPGAGSHVFNLPVADGTHTGKLLNTDWTTFNNKQAGNASLTALGALAGTGYITQTGANTFAERTLTGTANQVIITNGDGVAGAATFATPQDIATTSAPTFFNETLSNRLAVGNDATLVVNGAFDKFIDFSQTITDFTASGSFQGLTQYVNFAPTVNLTGGNAKYLYVAAQEAYVPSGNSKNIQQVESTYTRSSHQGSGTVTILYGNITQTDVTGTGSISSAVAQTVISSFDSIGTGNINIGQSLTSGGSLGTVTQDYTQYINPPNAGTTVTTHAGEVIANQSVAGQTTSFGLQFLSQSANAATTRAIEVVGTGISNAIRLGSSANIFANTANNIRLSNSTNVGGLDFNLTTTNATINTATQNTASIIFQNQTFTPGGAHIATVISPTWASGTNAAVKGLQILATQSGTNTNTMTGLELSMNQTTGATTLATIQGASILTPVVAGTVTNVFGLVVQNQSLVGSAGGFGIRINPQTANATTTRAMDVRGDTVANAIRFNVASNLYGTGASIRMSDSTDAGGLDFGLTTATTTINSIATTGSILLQSQTLTPGAPFAAVAISPTFSQENFSHSGLIATVTQAGTNTQALQGISISMVKTTGVTTLASMNGVNISVPTVTGTVTNSNAVNVSDQTNSSITTPRAINIAGTGVSNAEVWGGSALQYANAANNIRLADSSNTGGLDINLTTTSTTINTVTQNAAQILFQTQTLTPGGNFSAIVMNTTFASENFNHNQLFLNPTQSAGNTQLFQGLAITMNKTGGGTLATMNGVSLLSPVVSATVTASNAVRILDQGTAGITTPRGIRFTTAGVANSIVWANSALQYSTGAENISFLDSTNAAGFSFTMTAASTQTMASTFGNIALNVPTTNKVDFQVNAASVGSINATEFLASNGLKGHVTTSAAGVYTVLLTDYIVAKTGITGGGDIVTLPSAVTAGAGKIYVIQDTSGTALTNNITVNATAGNVNGGASVVIITNYGAKEFFSDGSNWFAHSI